MQQVNDSNGNFPLRRSYTNIVNFIEHRKLDRSVSEPTSRYKTELCRPFEENGLCKYGDKCQFAHGSSELRSVDRHPKYKTELCKTFHKTGFCPYGLRCHFVHNFEEARMNESKDTSNLCSSSSSDIHVIEMNTNIPKYFTTSSHMNVLIGCADSNDSIPCLRSFKARGSYQQQMQQQMLSSNSKSKPNKPKPLILSPAFSPSSVGDSISPTSSLSQSPTNSSVSFFSDETNFSVGGRLETLDFVQELCLLDRCSKFRQNQSLNQKTPFTEVSEPKDSPSLSTVDYRLPIFNKISETITVFNRLKI